MQKQAIIIGDSFNNTLGLVRSLGEGNINMILILVGGADRLFIAKSKYLCSENTYCIDTLDECLPTLMKVYDETKKQVLLCTNDVAATFINQNENVLSKYFVTPMSGESIGSLMNKAEQCALAEKCGLTVPQSFIYHRGDVLPGTLEFPVLLKPLYSVQGDKSDIHICHSSGEAQEYLKCSSICNDFIIQEFVEKEYEVNLLGVSTGYGIVIPGGIRKIRHYPTVYSPCSFGLYQSVEKLRIDTGPINKFIGSIGYKGLFSVEFLHKGDKNYFLEFNFRNDGLAYTATAAGVNLPAVYMSFSPIPTDIAIKETYMMDLSTDYCHVKEGNVSFRQWINDFRKTQCQLNYNGKDTGPTFYYYINKFKHKLHL